jgi:hypothetical protein
MIGARRGGYTPVTVQPNDYGLLLLLQEVRNEEDPVVQYFGCYDCLDLVGRETGLIHVHECATHGDETTLQL